VDWGDEEDAEGRAAAGWAPKRAGAARRRLPHVRGIDGRVVLGVLALCGLSVVAALELGFHWYAPPTGAMEPALQPGDWILVRDTHDVGRGDIVTFHGELETARGDTLRTVFVSRVVAVGGDVVDADDGRLRIDGQPVDEDYLPSDTVTNGFAAVTVPDGFVFMVSDNRPNARDSRFDGPVPVSDVQGRVVLDGLPWSPYVVTWLFTGVALAAFAAEVVRRRPRRPAPDLPPVEFHPS
jgi:signal peptidase I